MSNIRVLVITSTFPRFEGDTVTPFISDLVNCLSNRGVELDVIAPHAKGAKKFEQVGPRLNVHRFQYAWPEAAQTICYGVGALERLQQHPLDFLKLPFLVVAQMRAVRKMLRTRQYSCIHAHWLLPQAFTAAFCADRRTPLIATAHGTDVLALRGWLVMAAKRYALRRCSIITVNSSATEQAVAALSVEGKRIERIIIGASAACAIGGRKPRGSIEGRVTILFVGRLVAWKGADVLMRALPLVRAEIPGARLVIVGDGGSRASLEILSRSLGMTPHISFEGWLQPNEVAERMLSADMLVVPSITHGDGSTEAQGVVCLEAMLRDLPVVASRVGGLTDVVQDEKTGLLVPEGCPEELSAAIVRLARDPTLAMHISRAAREWAQNEGTMDRTADRFLALYQELAR